jgi:putative endonuclease
VGNTRALGNRGEDLAVSFLKKRGYRIRERNFYTRWGEIDIVAEKGGRLHLVEVRTVTRGGFLDPREALTRKKRDHRWRASQIYPKKAKWEGEYSVDFVAIEWDEREPVIHHYPQVLEDYWG